MGEKNMGGLRWVHAGTTAFLAPVSAFYRCHAGYVAVTGEGAFWSADRLSWKKMLSFKEPVPAVKEQYSAPRCVQAGESLFLFGSGQGAAFVCADGRTWTDMRLPEKWEGRPLAYRSAWQVAGTWYVFATLTRDNADFGMDEDLQYDSWIVTGILFSGASPEALSPLYVFDRAFPKFSVTGIVPGPRGGLYALLVSEPPDKGTASILHSPDGKTWTAVWTGSGREFGIDARAYKQFYAFNRNRLFVFGDRLCVRGGSVYALADGGRGLCDLMPTRVPASFEYVRVFGGSAYYHGTGLWRTHDFIRWECLDGRSDYGEAYLLEAGAPGVRVTAITPGGSIIGSGFSF